MCTVRHYTSEPHSLPSIFRPAVRIYIPLSISPRLFFLTPEGIDSVERTDHFIFQLFQICFCHCASEQIYLRVLEKKLKRQKEI